MKLLNSSAISELHKHIQKKFPKIQNLIEISKSITWNSFEFELKTEDNSVRITECLYYGVDGQYYLVDGRNLNKTLKEIQEEYEETLAKVTEAKFKYQILKVLVQPFSETLDAELKFDSGRIITSVKLKYKKVRYDVNVCSLLEETSIEDLEVYEYCAPYGIGIPIYDFVNDTDNALKKLKRMVSKINDIGLSYYKRKEKLDNRYTSILNKLQSKKEKEIAQLSNWKEN